MDPIKFYDYLASGKPIVTTRVPPVEKFKDEVHIADTPSEFVNHIQGILKGEAPEAWTRVRAEGGLQQEQEPDPVPAWRGHRSHRRGAKP